MLFRWLARCHVFCGASGTTSNVDAAILAKRDYILAQDLGGMMFWELSNDDNAHSLVDSMSKVLMP